MNDFIVNPTIEFIIESYINSEIFFEVSLMGALIYRLLKMKHKKSMIYTYIYHEIFVRIQENAQVSIKII